MNALLLSMTGFGEAHLQQQGMAIAVEVRTINSRYFKLSVRSGEGYGVLEPEIETLVRRFVRRGTIQVGLRVDRPRRADDYRLNSEVLDSYRRQLQSLATQWQLAEGVSLERLLSLPGVIDESRNPTDVGEAWPLIEQALEQGLAQLQQMREDEGRAMEADLRLNLDTIRLQLSAIERRAPEVVAAYRARLEDRLTKILAEYDVNLGPTDLIKEISLFTERSDISEEIVRMRSHLDQFDETLRLAESSGRKLEFLTQEMFRETNTIGSKSNDVEIPRHVIEIKAAIERMREMIQNVE